MTLAGVAETAAPSADFQFAAAVAEFGMLLTGSRHMGAASWAHAAEVAAASARGDTSRAALVEWIRKAAVAKARSEP